MEKVEWHSVVIFNPHLAKIALQYLNKGSKVYVEGKLQTRKWQDKNGGEHYTIEIVLPQFKGELYLLDAKKDQSASPTLHLLLLKIMLSLQGLKIIAHSLIMIAYHSD